MTETQRHTIASIPGDGIGKDVTSAALPVLHAAAEHYGFALDTTSFPWGCEYYMAEGRMLPDNGIEQLRPFDAIFMGAIGYPSLVPDHISLHELLLKIRRDFRQFVNMRPHRVLAGVESPLRSPHLDLLVIRENSENSGTQRSLPRSTATMSLSG